MTKKNKKEKSHRLGMGAWSWLYGSFPSPRLLEKSEKGLRESVSQFSHSTTSGQRRQATRSDQHRKALSFVAIVCADFVPWSLERCEKEQRAAGSSKLKCRATSIPPMTGHLLLAASPKSNKVLTYSLAARKKKRKKVKINHTN